jgi:uncharacterized protein
VIYLDSAALVKLTRVENETAALVRWLTEHPTAPLVSSTLIEVEVPRALRRHAPAALTVMPAILSRVVRVDMEGLVRATAAAFQDIYLRSLDSIHLATALLLNSDGVRRIDAFVTYDKRLLAAAGENGLPVAAPGAG